MSDNILRFRLLNYSYSVALFICRNIFLVVDKATRGAISGILGNGFQRRDMRISG